MSSGFDASWQREQRHQYYLERFCERLIQATADQPNVMYEIFNEGEWYHRGKLRSFQAHFVRFFKARTNRVTMVDDDRTLNLGFRSEDDCDVLSNHLPNWTPATSALDAFTAYASEFYKTPSKPLFFSEPVPEYQGDPSWHDALMRLMWGTALAGAGFVVQNDTSFGFDPHTLMAAQAANRDKVLDLEGHCVRFFNASGVDFGSMAPDGSLASSGVCLANVGQEYVVYAQNGASVTVDLAALTGEATARFHNPRTGQVLAGFQVAGGASAAIGKPDGGDWVLHIKRKPAER
jgi:hypothetical protein